MVPKKIQYLIDTMDEETAAFVIKEYLAENDRRINGTSKVHHDEASKEVLRRTRPLIETAAKRDPIWFAKRVLELLWENTPDEELQVFTDNLNFN